MAIAGVNIGNISNHACWLAARSLCCIRPNHMNLRGLLEPINWNPTCDHDNSNFRPQRVICPSSSVWQQVMPSSFLER
jgi:hypothetical protein